MYPREVYDTLLHFKRNRQDFNIKYHHYDDDEHKHETITTTCGWYWEVSAQGKYYPEKITLYDKGWDDDLELKIDDIIYCQEEPCDTPPSNFNNIIDDMYNLFCQYWDRREYENAEWMIKHISDLIIDRINYDEVCNTPPIIIST